MALTKIEMYLTIIMVVLIFAFSISIVGQDFLASDDITLDSKSEEYVQTFTNNLDANNFSDYSTNVSKATKESNPLVDAITGIQIVEDVLGGIKFFTEKLSALWSTLAFIYNIPAFFIWGFGLPSGAFTHILNIISWILFLAVTIMLVRMVK